MGVQKQQRDTSLTLSYAEGNEVFSFSFPHFLPLDFLTAIFPEDAVESVSSKKRGVYTSHSLRLKKTKETMFSLGKERVHFIESVSLFASLYREIATEAHKKAYLDLTWYEKAGSTFLAIGVDLVAKGEYLFPTQIHKRIESFFHVQPTLVYSNHFGVEQKGFYLFCLDCSQEKLCLEGNKGAFLGDLIDCIATLENPIFSLTNDEEILRQMVFISQEVRYVTDIPQVLIRFEKQTRDQLLYTVILCRIRKDEETITSLLEKKPPRVVYRLERVKEMGQVRQKYAKEVSVLLFRLDKSSCLRKDLSLNLYLARDTLLRILREIVGPLRDFNGGLLSKEKLLLLDVKKELEKEGYHEFLLENIFYQIGPYGIKPLIEPETPLLIYHMAVESYEKKQVVLLRKGYEGWLMLVQHEDKDLLEEVGRDLLQVDYSRNSWLYSLFDHQESSFLAAQYMGLSDEERKQFFLHLVHSLQRHLPQVQLHPLELSQVLQESSGESFEVANGATNPLSVINS